MKTLINDPFMDDAIGILRWAYGEGAAEQFLRFVIHTQRIGQAFMNTLYLFDPVEYNRLTGSLVDPFHQDTMLPAAIDKLTSK